VLSGGRLFSVAQGNVNVVNGAATRACKPWALTTSCNLAPPGADHPWRPVTYLTTGRRIRSVKIEAQRPAALLRL